MKRLASIDSETGPIGSRPDYPPRAVGYAVEVEGRKPEYWAFGHPSGNNCTKEEAIARVKEVSRDNEIVFHNSDFDLEVMAADGIKPPSVVHDTMRLAFLNEPRSRDLGLKPQAAQFLKRPAEEQGALRNWIIENIPEARKRARRDKDTGNLVLKDWGDYICKAPGTLVSPYAKGDVSRTIELFRFYSNELEKCDQKYEESNMVMAYQREMALIPIKLRMENLGIRLRKNKLKRELPAYRKVLTDLDEAIRRRLHQAKGFNVGSANQLADALLENDLLSQVVRTKTGKVSTKRSNLVDYCTDKKLTTMLSMRGTLKTYLGTFMEKWLEVAERNDGYIQPTFNTVRGTDEYGGSGGYGTRTGRFSSSDPNFQNIPSNAADSPHKPILLELAKALRRYNVDFVGLRDYFAPDDGCVFIRRDYNQQELRILAHRENGPFLRMYQENPRLDAHELVRALVREATGVDYTRKHIKQTNFGILYGMGLLKLAARLGLDIDEAKELRSAVLTAIPGVRLIMNTMKKLARDEEPFFTWGGRRYFCEEPTYVITEDGGKQKRTYEYKMMNTDIQGSAADCTKKGMIQVDQNMGRGGRIVLQVHDELVSSVPIENARREMARMREAMEDVAFRVPMLSDGEVGGVSWARMRKVPTW